MSKLNINIGSKANDKSGDTLRTAFDKINQNFTELYTLTGGTSTALTELAQDYAAPLFNHASHTNITVTYDDANNKILLTGVAAQVQTDWNASSGLGVILNKPTLFSGSYTDLTNKPTIPSAYTLPTASASVLGGIKIGTGLSIDVNGVVTASSGSVSSLVNGANTVSLDNGGLDLTFTSGEKIKTIFGGGIELYRSGDNTIGIYTGGAEIKTFATGGAKHLWTFGTDGTTTFPNNSIKNSPDSNTAITTQRTLTANNSYTNGTDFSTDVDLGGGNIIAGWYQRNAEQIEFALFGPSAFISYLTGLALGRTVIVTYNTAGGTSTLTRTLTQEFISTGQTDPNNPSWGRVSGRINATLPVGQLGIVSINFPVYSTSTNNWTFGANGNLETPGGVQVAGILKIDDGVHEKFQTKADATGIVTHDCSLGHIFYHTSPDALFTVNFTNLNLSSGYATALTLIIEQGGTGFIPNSVGIGGVIQTLNWQGNVTPTPSTNRTDVVTFSIINVSGTYTVLGQLTGF